MRTRNITAATDYILKVVEVIKQRCTFTTELWLHASFFFEDPTVYDESVVKSKWHEEANKKIGLLVAALEQQEDFDSKAIDTFLHDFLEKNKFKAGDVLPLLRVMLIGAKNGPAVYEIISVLGKEKSLERIDKAISSFKGMQLNA